MIELQDVSKRFTLHNQSSAVIEVFSGVTFAIKAGECVALTGASGTGKSTLMRMIYGNYAIEQGAMRIRGTDISSAAPRLIMQLRQSSIGYVSQFLRVVPRVPTREVVAEPLRQRGMPKDVAEQRAESLLSRLNIPKALWSLSPTTFSGGEQQRVNIARGFAHPYPALLLDEPTASLDPENRDVVLSMIAEAKLNGSSIVGIFHDQKARAAVCDREIDISQFTPERAA